MSEIVAVWQSVDMTGAIPADAITELCRPMARQMAPLMEHNPGAAVATLEQLNTCQLGKCMLSIVSKALPFHTTLTSYRMSPCQGLTLLMPLCRTNLYCYV